MEKAPKAEGFVVIGGRVYPANQVVSALIAEGFADIKLEPGGTLIISGVRIPPIFKSPQEQAMVITCYGSLAYCCGLEKTCENRDKALELLGLTKEDYLRLKNHLHNKFIEYSKRLTVPSEIDLRYYTYEGSTPTYSPPRKPVAAPDIFENVESTNPPPLITPEKTKQERNTIEPISDIFNNSEEQKPSEWPPSQSYRDRPLFTDQNDEFSFCIYCGSTLPPMARYCKKCGKPAL
jgi:ribosomal protein L40E